MCRHVGLNCIAFVGKLEFVFMCLAKTTLESNQLAANIIIIIIHSPTALLDGDELETDTGIGCEKRLLSSRRSARRGRSKWRVDTMKVLWWECVACMKLDCSDPEQFKLYRKKNSSQMRPISFDELRMRRRRGRSTRHGGRLLTGNVFRSNWKEWRLKGVDDLKRLGNPCFRHGHVDVHGLGIY